MNFVWSKLVLSIALFGFATSLHASTISGVVKDPSGALIKGAKVEIRGKKHKDLRFFVRTLLGDEQGQNLHFIQESRKADGSFYIVLPMAPDAGKDATITVEYAGDKVEGLDAHWTDGDCRKYDALRGCGHAECAQESSFEYLQRNSGAVKLSVGRHGSSAHGGRNRSRELSFQ